MSPPAPPVRPAVRVTIGQIDAGTDRTANYAAAEYLVRAAATRHADLLVLPEYASVYDPRGVGVEHAEPLSGRYVTELRAEAARRGVAVIAGTVTPGADPGLASNTVVAVDATGELLGTYRKVHLYDAFGHRESERLEPGPPDAAPLVVQVAGLRLGIITCYDLRFPESARRVVDAGAQVVVVPAAWAAGPGKAAQWRALAVARAIENTSAVLAVGQAGKGRTGCSLLIGPDGTVAVELGEQPDTVTVDIDPAGIGAVREVNPSLANRRYTVVPRPEPQP